VVGGNNVPKGRPEDGGRRVLRNFDIQPSHYTAQNPENYKLLCNCHKHLQNHEEVLKLVSTSHSWSSQISFHNESLFMRYSWLTANYHTMMETPVLVRSPKLSNISTWMDDRTFILGLQEISVLPEF